MNKTYWLEGHQFEWDSNKDRINRRKHGVTFKEAAEVFLDPFYQTGDASVGDGEEREFILGYSLSLRMLLLIYTERGIQTRIISARPATSYERKLYQDA